MAVSTVTLWGHIERTHGPCTSLQAHTDNSVCTNSATFPFWNPQYVVTMVGEDGKMKGFIWEEKIDVKKETNRYYSQILISIVRAYSLNELISRQMTLI